MLKKIIATPNKTNDKRMAVSLRDPVGMLIYPGNIPKQPLPAIIIPKRTTTIPNNTDNIINPPFLLTVK